nr:HAD-IA family hydrolase [Paenibacillus xerothermodurans]
MNITYMKEANHNVKSFEDIIPFLTAFKRTGMKGAVLTNGPSDGQRDKINALGLHEYFDKVYISAEVGFGKPQKEAFQYVLDDLNLLASDCMDDW